MKPSAPTPDAYTGHVQIKPHFAGTPGLTQIPRETQPLREIVATNRAIVEALGVLLRKHAVAQCKHLGLFWAGSKDWVSSRCPSRPDTRF